ncbi:hypothetical protein SAMN04488550_4392 [Gordonia malaquae]|uniref:Uncharacterized protein n=1 Tax=Gordonia malaquae NBRC 108250 TaxID=1223542 RepID=M3VAX0_GORML|nr:hypothetical protein [Gordonia malaquae]GAC79248.1 hypothetical protein GM1_008_00100 [Gordonia malaquae NBRC 108250]SEE36738.1 hypothetical protein SAMN04488550_4392 [Gordonia malaquae]
MSAARGIGYVRDRIGDDAIASAQGFGRRIVGQSVDGARMVGRQVQARVADIDVASMPRTDRASGVRPVAVTVSTWLLGAAAALVVLQIILVGLLLNRAVSGFSFASALVSAETGEADMMAQSRLVVVGVLAVVAMVVVAGYVAVAIGARRGRTWPRKLGAVFAVLSLPALLLGPAADIAVLCGVAAVIVLWLPVSRRFCTESGPRA